MFFQCTFVRSSASSQFSHSCFILFVLISFTSVIILASSDACYFYRSSHPLPLRPFTAIEPPLIRGLNLAPLRCPHRRSEAALDTETTTLNRVETGEETKVTVMSSPHTLACTITNASHTLATRAIGQSTGQKLHQAPVHLSLKRAHEGFGARAGRRDALALALA